MDTSRSLQLSQLLNWLKGNTKIWWGIRCSDPFICQRETGWKYVYRSSPNFCRLQFRLKKKTTLAHSIKGTNHALNWVVKFASKLDDKARHLSTDNGFPFFNEYEYSPLPKSFMFHFQRRLVAKNLHHMSWCIWNRLEIFTTNMLSAMTTRS